MPIREPLKDEPSLAHAPDREGMATCEYCGDQFIDPTETIEAIVDAYIDHIRGDHPDEGPL